MSTRRFAVLSPKPSKGRLATVLNLNRATLNHVSIPLKED